MEDQDHEQDNGSELLNHEITKLTEHFDSITIFAQKRVGNRTTKHYYVLRGNYFANYGQIVSWVRAEDSQGLYSEDQ